MRSLLVGLYLVAWLTTVRAGVGTGPTLDWLVDTSPLIGLYQLESVKPHPFDEEDFARVQHSMPGYSRHRFEQLDLVVTLVDKLRGLPPVKMALTGPAYTRYDDSVQVRFDLGDRFLVCLQDVGTTDVHKEQVISLTKPVIGGEMRPPLLPDFSVPTDGDLIEKIVVDRIASKPFTKQTREDQSILDGDAIMVEIPISSQAASYVSGKRFGFLIVPKDLVPISQVASPKLGYGFRTMRDVIDRTPRSSGWIIPALPSPTPPGWTSP